MYRKEDTGAPATPRVSETHADSFFICIELTKTVPVVDISQASILQLRAGEAIFRFRTQIFLVLAHWTQLTVSELLLH